MTDPNSITFIGNIEILEEKTGNIKRLMNEKKIDSYINSSDSVVIRIFSRVKPSED